MQKNINILFLGGANRVSLAQEFINAGKHLGLNVCIFSYELTSFVPIAEVGKIVLGKRWADPFVLEHLESVVQMHKINMVLPFVDPAIGLVAILKARIHDVFMPVCAAETADIFFDKRLANKWFSDHLIPIPEFDGAIPAIAKPATGSASKGILVLDSLEKLNEFNAREDKDSFLLQKYIDGDEYTVDCYADCEGKLVAAVSRKRLEVTGGEATKTISVKHAGIDQIVLKIFLSGVFRGPNTVQFIEEASSGNIFIMEINPRFGGGVLCSIKAGMNVPLFILQEYLGQALGPFGNWDAGVLMVRSFREHYFYADNH